MIAAGLLAACGSTSKEAMRSEWEIANERLLTGEAVEQTAVPAPPAYPLNANLAEFSVATPGNKYYVDRSSLAVAGGHVHYVIVVRSPSGAENVSFEALNCKDREFRSYARGTSERKWLVRPTEWRKVRPQSDFAQFTLHREYFCPHTTTIRDAAEGKAALQRGGHPKATTHESGTR